MLRRPFLSRARLLAAVLVTTAAIVLGVVLIPGADRSPSAVDASSGTSGLRDSGVDDRAVATSRDAVRPTVTAWPGTPATRQPSKAPAGGRPEATGPAGSADTSPTPEPAPQRDLQPAPQSAEPPAAAPADLAVATERAAAALPPFRVRGARRLHREPPAPVAGAPFTFQIGTLNILGSQHQRNGTGRAAALAGAIIGRGVDLVGLQEVQDDQLAVLQSRLDGYTIWPGQGLGNQGVRLQIAFRDALFALVDTGSITTTFDFQRRPIPWVLLQDRATGAEFYVIDVHNSPRGQEADRDAATGAEISLVNSLRSTGKPVFLVGDTNERTEFACRVAAATGMVGSNGLNASGGGCSTGAGPLKIDHVMGVGGVEFSDYVVDYDPPVRASTDHAFVRATVTVTPSVPQD